MIFKGHNVMLDRTNHILNMISDFRETANDLLTRSQDFNETIAPRRWKGNELADLIGLKNIRYLYPMEKNEKLPEWFRDERNDNGGYTLEMAIEAMRVLDTLPWRYDDEEPVVLSFTNFKGGCWKTSTAWNVGSYYASLGYRVLMTDVDPQASLTRNLGFKPDVDIRTDDTMANLLAGNEEPTAEAVRQRVLKTHVPTMDLIPASLDLQAVEWLLSAELYSISQSAQWNQDERADMQADIFLNLAKALQTVTEDYDIIILDGTPTLGILPLNIIFASHGLVVPVPAEKLDFASTKSFLDLLEDHLRQLHDRFGDRLTLPEPWFFVTKFDVGQSTTDSETMLEHFIKPTFRDRLLDTVVYTHKKAISLGSFFSRTMFDVSSTTLAVRNDVRSRCMKNYENLGQEILEKIVFPHWPRRLQELELAKEVKGGTN